MLLIKNTGEDSHAHNSALQSGSLERLNLVSLVRTTLVRDKDRVGKILVGSTEGFVQLVP